MASVIRFSPGRRRTAFRSPRCGEPVAAPPVELPLGLHAGASAAAPREGLLSLEGEGLAAHFRAWFGRSGRRYVVTIHDIASAAAACDYEGALLLAVRRDGHLAPSLIGGRDSSEAGQEGAALENRKWLGQMRKHGATELHVHLLARDGASRRETLRDLVA